MELGLASRTVYFPSLCSFHSRVPTQRCKSDVWILPRLRASSSIKICGPMLKEDRAGGPEAAILSTLVGTSQHWGTWFWRPGGLFRSDDVGFTEERETGVFPAPGTRRGNETVQGYKKGSENSGGSLEGERVKHGTQSLLKSFWWKIQCQAEPAVTILIVLRGIK